MPVGFIVNRIVHRVKGHTIQCQVNVQAIFKCPTAGYFQMSRFKADGFLLT